MIQHIDIEKVTLNFRNKTFEQKLIDVALDCKKNSYCKIIAIEQIIKGEKMRLWKNSQKRVN